MAMSRTKEYKCANNFFMRNMLYTATPSIPYRPAAITALKEFFFSKGPAAFPMTLHVAVPGDVDPTKDPTKVLRISPEEMEFAFLEAIVHSIVSSERSCNQDSQTQSQQQF